MLLLHIGAFQLDIDSKRQTVWHQLVPQTRILCVLILLLAVVLTPNGHWWSWTLYASGILFLLLVSQVTIAVLLQRLAVELAFAGVVLLGTLFREGGTVIWRWGWLQVTTTGLLILGSVVFKALLSLALLNLLTLTTSVPALLHGMAVLRIPPLLIAILASMYRYLGVLIEEFNSMRRAALSRNLMSSRQRQRLVIGNMIGSLFIRTYERGERVHQAMLSRGYTGLPPVTDMPRASAKDIVALTLATLFALLGQVVYLLP